jgi:hypothetical protein
MTSASRARPQEDEFKSFYAGYVALVPDGDIVDVLRAKGEEMRATLAAIPEASGGHAYAEGKWTIRTVIGHTIDAERIFAYRALRIGRGDTQPLPGFEENAYAASADSDARTMADLVDELAAVRDCTVRLFASLPDVAWTRRGTASLGEVSVRAIAYIVAGHAQHHMKILRERYLPAS